MHALHRQSRLVLHASLVPQFSGLTLPEGISPEMTSVSARIVCSSAVDISCLADDLSTMAWDTARIPAFVGYCLYAAASIHIAVLGVSDSVLAERARGHLISALRLLKPLKMYWLVLKKLVSCKHIYSCSVLTRYRQWTRISILYATQMRHMRCVEAPTTSASLFHNLMRPRLKDLDQLAREVRDPGQLAEPLADSVLEYSLRRLDPAPHKIMPSTIQDFNETTMEDQIEALLEETPPATQPLLAENDFLLSHERIDLNMDNQAADSHGLSAVDPAFFDAAQLLEPSSQDSIAPFFASWFPSSP